MTGIKIVAVLILCIYSSLFHVVKAQKLPSVQKITVRLPVDAKIDGHPSEWNNKFQAYNSNTSTFYTIANDDDMLYLIVQATDQLVIRKIIAGGISFSINLLANKKETGATFTFPNFPKTNRPDINLKNIPVVARDSTVGKKQMDPFRYVINKQLTDKSKEIKVYGVKDLDTIVSVYNEDGIEAAALFDNRIAYNYELAIPLKYLKPFIDGQGKFSYTIKLNGSFIAEGGRFEEITGGMQVVGISGNKGIPSVFDMQFIAYPTYFSGVCKLAKK